MKNIDKNWDSIEIKIKKSPLVLLALDFDGTLTPIMPSPYETILDRKTRKILSQLTRNKRYRVAIISGRSLRDIKRLVKLRSLIYSGNHGYEIQGGGIQFCHPLSVSFYPIMSFIRRYILKNINNIEGYVLENKLVTLSLHYRKVKKRFIKLINSTVKKSVSFHMNKVSLLKGKGVFEIRPNLNWHKGEALKVIENSLSKQDKVLTIYIGDDRTDNDVFKVMHNNDIPIFVGENKKTSAKYYLKDISRVQNFLLQLNKI